MSQRRPWGTITFFIIGLGCGPDSGDASGQESSTGESSEDGSTNAEGASGENTSGDASTSDEGTSASEDTGDTGDDDDSGSTGETEPFGVDCSTLPAGGPTIAPEPLSPTGFPVGFCNPRQERLESGPYRCCSDDPAATAGNLPAYPSTSTDAEVGEPIFSALGNELGVSGMCVDTSGVAPGSGLSEADNCPIPCNPTWAADAVEAVCGANRVCCQTRELQAADCVSDGAGGARPATGADIFEGLTNWSSAAHATHQDPNGIGCQQFAGCSGDGCNQADAYRDCLLQLSVANQRGFCLALPPGASCPAAAPDYIDACERM